MKLVHLENYEVKMDEELLLLKPFRTLYNTDKSKSKEKFIEFLSIVYFLIDPRSDYQYIVSEDLRLREICESNGYKLRDFNKQEQECIELYRKLTTTTSLELLKSTKVAIEKVRNFLENVDLNAVDEKGKPLYTINSVTSAIKMIPSLAKDVTEAEKSVAKEIEEQGRARGNSGSKSLMDDGILM